VTSISSKIILVALRRTWHQADNIGCILGQWLPSHLRSALTVNRDAYGNVLHDGDSVIIIKELKVKGSSSAVKIGTKVKGIRLQEGEDEHNISCKIAGFGAMNLKSEFVKKA
jgi:alkylphosphonate utilization operon protein PhnA